MQAVQKEKVIEHLLNASNIPNSSLNLCPETEKSSNSILPANCKCDVGTSYKKGVKNVGKNTGKNIDTDKYWCQ